MNEIPDISLRKLRKYIKTENIIVAENFSPVLTIHHTKKQQIMLFNNNYQQLSSCHSHKFVSLLRQHQEGVLIEWEAYMYIVHALKEDPACDKEQLFSS